MKGAEKSKSSGGGEQSGDEGERRQMADKKRAMCTY